LNGTESGVSCAATTPVRATHLWDYTWLFLALVVPLAGALIKAFKYKDSVRLLSIAVVTGTHDELRKKKYTLIDVKGESDEDGV